MMSEEDKTAFEKEIREKVEAERLEQAKEIPERATEGELKADVVAKTTKGILSGNLMPVALVSLGVTILVILMLGAIGGGSFVVKKDFETNMVNMAVAIETAMVDIQKAQGETKEIIATMPDSIGDAIAGATKEFSDWRIRLDSAVSTNKQQLDANTNRMDSIESNVASSVANSIANSDAAVAARLAEGNEVLDETVIAVEELAGWRGRMDNTIVAQNERIDALEVLVVILEDELYNGHADEDGDSPISIKISDSGGVLVASLDGNTLSVPIKFTLTKSADRAYEDIVIFVELETDGIENVTSARLYGPGVTWRSSGWQSGVHFFSLEFMNVGWGLDMSKGDTKKNIRATLEIKGSGYQNEEYNFKIDAEVYDWE